MSYEIPELFINNRSYSIEEIIERPDVEYEDDFTKSILDFCKAWYSNQNSFTIFTSGSTGKPKQIEISRHQMTTSAVQTIGFFDLKRNDKLLLCLNPNFIGGKMMLVRAFTNNMGIFAITPSSNPLVKIDSSEKIDFTALSPHQLFTILNGPVDKIEILEKMKAIIVGGAPVDFSLQKKVQQLRVPVYSTYGMTETISHVALHKINGIDRTDFFQGVGNVEFGTEERGCLTVKGDVTNNITLITNDRVDLLSQKRFRWLGRVDNVINSGGIKIQIEELENKINEILDRNAQSCRFFLFSQLDVVLGQKLCIAFESLYPIDVSIMTILNDSLNFYERPKEIYYFERFIETKSGKIDKKRTVQSIEKKDIE